MAWRTLADKATLSRRQRRQRTDYTDQGLLATDHAFIGVNRGDYSERWRRDCTEV
jgi:hypothetical protein